jgi:hypothetical protein
MLKQKNYFGLKIMLYWMKIFLQSKNMIRAKKLIEQLFPKANNQEEIENNKINIEKEINYKKKKYKKFNEESYIDEDGDIASEFYIASKEGGFKLIWPRN